jgi:hypothetical protein
MQMLIKVKTLLLVITCIFPLIFCSFTATATAQILQDVNTIKVELDGNELVFDQPPVIINNLTMVPLRKIFESLGAEIHWDQATSTVTATKEQTIVKLTIGSLVGYVNDQQVPLDTAAVVLNDRTLVPVRFIVSAFGAKTTWDDVTKTVRIVSKDSSATQGVYELELKRWGVYNDGTHPLETTKGINDALKWANTNQISIFKIPLGTYLIAKGEKAEDTKAAINLLSNMTFELDKNTVLLKETNGYEGYSVIYVGKNVENVTIKGGIIKGDRDAHNYSQKIATWSAGTHEWGYGINIAGGRNIIVDGVKIEKMTGDGIIITGSTITSSSIKEDDLEVGGLDGNGNPITEKGKIRSNNRKVTNFDNPAYKQYRNIYMWLPVGVTPGFDIFYYGADGKFIKADKGLRFYTGESTIPDGADYFRAVFDAPSTKGVSVTRMTIDNAKNVTIKNNDIGYNRRQGITAGGENVQILNNNIHHTSGTSPQAGIDIEPGYYPAKNHLIKGNTFIDNIIQVVLSYGENVTIDGNYFEQKNVKGAGLHIHQGYRGDIAVNNNKFNGSNMMLLPDNVKVSNNEFINSQVVLNGNNQTFDNATFTGSSLRAGSIGSGQKISNITINQNGMMPHALYLGDKQLSLQNVTINANSDKSKNQGLILGNGNDASVYDHVSVVDEAHRGSVLPRGTYNNALFNAGGLEINREGKYVINNSSIKDKGSLLSIHKLYGQAPDVTINNTSFEMTENTVYGAAIYVQGVKQFTMTNNTIVAKNNTLTTPIIKFGPLGYSKATQIFAVTMKGNTIVTKKGLLVAGIDTLNAGTDAPKYQFENNILYNAKLKLTTKDSNVNNKEIIE